MELTLFLVAFLVGLGIATAFLWFTIRIVTGKTSHRWREIFIWILFFALISSAKNYMQIFSVDAGLILIVRLLSISLVCVLLYFLLGLRLKIVELRKKILIVLIYIGVRLIIGLLVNPYFERFRSYFDGS